MLTPEKARKRVRKIQAMAGDPEAAHGAEDELWREALLAIRDGSKHPRTLAEIALETESIRFPRWMA